MIYADRTEDLELLANNKLRQLYDWGVTNKLSFNVHKTNCVLFTKRPKYMEPKIDFNGERLELKTNFKYLGVIIDSKLSWRPHGHYIKNKVSQVSHNLISFAKNKYGLNEKSMEVIIKEAILPIISYCCSVYW
jgi:hypothetical protein